MVRVITSRVASPLFLRLLCLAVLPFFPGCAGGEAGPPVSTPPPKVADTAKKGEEHPLFARVRREGRIPVMVSLLQTGSIAESQERLSQAMVPFRVEEVVKFKYTPQVSLWVSAEGLAFLLGSPLVASVEEDKTGMPLMAPGEAVQLP